MGEAGDYPRSKIPRLKIMLDDLKIPQDSFIGEFHTLVRGSVQWETFLIKGLKANCKILVLGTFDKWKALFRESLYTLGSIWHRLWQAQ